MKKEKKLRIAFREAVFERDEHKCKFCSSTENLDAHHIVDRHEMPNGGYVKENGITFCEDCHFKAEVYHRTNGEQYVQYFHPENLYNHFSMFLIARPSSCSCRFSRSTRPRRSNVLWPRPIRPRAALARKPWKS